MAISAASLADGQLPSSKSTLYTVPTARAAHWVQARFVNTDASARTINIYVKRAGSSSRRVIDKDHSIAAGALYVIDFGTKGITLSTGDIIEGDASAAAVVDYFFSGGTE